MFDLVVVGFDTPKVLLKLASLGKEYLVDLEDAVVVVRDGEGKVHLKQSLKPASVGAGSGLLSGSLVDYGIEVDFIKSLAATIPNNSSALFVLVRNVQPEKMLAEFEGLGGRVLKTSLAPEQEERLRTALQETAATAS